LTFIAIVLLLDPEKPLSCDDLRLVQNIQPSNNARQPPEFGEKLAKYRLCVDLPAQILALEACVQPIPAQSYAQPFDQAHVD
jgi:hypothetical protein